ncbi:ABC transporter ATP-binding protein [Uliginosibacterium sediminicola]|uniref:ABC transporter ATP-binding protein n=1 Tax=Uliginosibacterium sediminicola TaxID=2024550 RepID=A0ABU9YWS4_9RHOO
MNTPLLRVERLVKHFKVGRNAMLHAVDDISLDIAPGESVGLVGESGCGKSTLSRVLARLIDADSGHIHFHDGAQESDLAASPAARFARHAQRGVVQMVFQDANDSLNPRYLAQDTIAEPLRLLVGMKDAAAIKARVEELAGWVGLPTELLGRYPHQLSGGQKARVGIARALASSPRLLILDEPTAALDVSVQATVLQLLADLKARLGLSYLFVSHDLNVVRLLCDRVVVMYLGKVVEQGPAQEVFAHPHHPYTQMLVAAIPDPHRKGQPAQIMQGEARSPINPDPRACRFHGRCPHGEPRCELHTVSLREVAPQHLAACHLLED